MFSTIVKIHQESCDYCGFSSFSHNGHYVSRVTYLTANASEPVYLELHKERLICKNCGRSFMANSDIVDKNCCISKATRQKILMNLKDDRTQTSIAIDAGVSSSTICRYLDNYDDLFHRNLNYLPVHLAMDEFRGVGGKLHFICINGNGVHEIQQILPDRYKNSIIEYFKQFPESVRARVKTVTVDLNSYYQDIAKLMFPNAKIVIDRFHIIAKMTRAFNQSRVQTMKKYNKQSAEYRTLKFSWRLYLKYAKNLDEKQLFYDRHLRKQLTQLERVEEGLAVSPELKASYESMQNIMKSLKDHDKDGIVNYLYNTQNSSRQMKEIFRTFKKNLEVILNASETGYSNGPVEGMNRMIKQIQRTAFGFRNYHHMISRIKLRQMKTKPDKKAELKVA
ncbi:MULTISPECIES: ISL3 family transposase [Amylolactobacillus]|uniref:ISL3 family transposase n=1 Tax=Amylolactobacillus amylophilus TaxID=1603 RepID=UPI0021006558|nr:MULTISPECIES: ISL3 family transposase [Amylolactobacillus]